MDGDVLTEAKVVEALRILFVGAGQLRGNLICSVQLPEIKKAYRRRALDTHPDRFAWADEDHRKRCTERFLEVTDAYETLSTYLALRDKGFVFEHEKAEDDGRNREGHPFRKRKPEPASRFGDRAEAFSSFSFWGRGVPDRALRFGEFLYYSGVIPWRALINALAWQRRQRPRIGEIAQRWRWCTEVELMELLRGRRLGERVGEVLLRRGLISPFQLDVLLWQQRKIQKRIGEYFLDQGLLTGAQIRRHLQHQQRHNVRFSRSSLWGRDHWSRNRR